MRLYTRSVIKRSKAQLAPDSLALASLRRKLEVAGEECAG